MDRHVRLESSKDVGSPDISPTTTTTTTTTTTRVSDNISGSTTTTKIVKSDPMIIPTSSSSTTLVNGDASPSPSKRMRYELFISTPFNEDSGKNAAAAASAAAATTLLSPNLRPVDAELIDFPKKKETCVSTSGSDDLRGQRKERNGKHDDDGRSTSKLSRSGLVRLGFRSLDGVAEEAQGEKGSEEASLRIRAVLPERFHRPVALTKVLVAQIFDPTKSAIFLQAICQEFRLPESLSHLKRVKSVKITKENGKSEVILHVIIRNIPALSDAENDADIAARYFCESLSALTASSSSSSTEPDLASQVASIGSPYLARVSNSPPLTRAQYDAARTHWPCTFHEDKRITSLIDGRYFSEAQADAVRANLTTTMRVAEEAKRLYRFDDADCDACVIVDPKDNVVVSVAHDLSPFENDDDDDDDDDDENDGGDSIETRLDPASAASRSTSLDRRSSSSSSDVAFKIRPYYHAPMVAIDLVAASQGGGAYAIPVQRFPLMSFTPMDSASPTATTTKTTVEINDDDDVDDDGAKNEEEADDDGGGNATYLCTGYDVYLSKEPCLMCAMSLIHSRIRRLFYRHKSADGALGSKFSIHTLESLNHHFEAFCLE